MESLLSTLGAVTWNWDPELFHVGPFEVFGHTINFGLRYYGVLFALALAAGYYTLRKMYRDENEDPETATNFSYALIASVIIGTRLFHCFFYDWDRYSANPIEILYFWKGGLASHGAAAGIILTCVIYDLVFRKTPCRVSLDRMAMTIPFAMICIRLGNFFNSEIVGARCDLMTSPIQCTNDSWFAFIFPRYIQNGLPDPFLRYPSQLFEVGMGIIACIVMYSIYHYYRKNNKPRPLGLMFSLILVLYFGMRFFVEYFKEYQVVENIGGLREGQILSIPFFIVGVIGLIMCLFGPWKNQNVMQYTGKYQLKKKDVTSESEEEAENKSEDKSEDKDEKSEDKKDSEEKDEGKSEDKKDSEEKDEGKSEDKKDSEEKDEDKSEDKKDSEEKDEGKSEDKKDSE